jgi:hypothetical protein
MKAWCPVLPVLVLGLLMTPSGGAQQVGAGPAKRTGPVRVAVIAPPGVDAVRAVGDLALAQLGAEREIVLLERAAVDRLLGEQKLSLAGLVDADTAARAGKILAADLLAVLETSPQEKQALGCTVFDAGTGARLFDAGFSRPDPAQQAREVAAGVRVAVHKWRAGTKNLKTVCFLPVRNADLPRSMDPFCEALALSLERQVLHLPTVVTLERKRLDAVTREKGLAQAAATRELLASVLLVETEVGRAAGGDGIRAVLTVRDSGGKLLHKVTQAVPNAGGAGLLEPLARGLHEALHAAQGPPLVQRNREARRFLREAEVLWKHRQYRPALQAAEAAYALRSDDAARLLLAQYLDLFAWETWRPGIVAATRFSHQPFPLGPEKVREGLDLVRRGQQLIDAGKPRPSGTPDNGGFWSLAESSASFYAEYRVSAELCFVQVRPPNPATEEEIPAFRRRCVQRQVQRVRELVGRLKPNPQDIQRLNSALINTYVSQIQTVAPDSGVLAHAIREVLSAWLDLSRRLPAQAFPTHKIDQFAYYVLAATYSTGTRYLVYTTADRELMLPLFQAMQEHPHPVVRLFGAYYQTKQLLKLGRLSAGQAEERRRQLMADARRLIDHPPFKQPDRQRIAFYLFLDHVLQDHRPGSAGAAFEEGLAVVNFMLERGDVVTQPWVHVAGLASVDRKYHARDLNLIRRMEEAYDAPRHRVFSDPFFGGAKRQLSNIKWNILKMSPQFDKQPPALAWDRVVRLVEVLAVPHANALLAPTRQARQVYLFAGGTDPVQNRPFLQLVRAALDGSPPKLLGKAFVHLKDFDPKDPKHAFWNLPRFLTECTVLREHLYAGTVDDGIYVFPLTGGDAVHIGAEEGLPAPQVVSLAAADGKLVAVLEGGYLVVYDPGTDRCDVIASSRRTQAASPFDNAKPFRARDLRADPERHRVLFLLMGDTFAHPNTGTWAYNLETRQFLKLTPLFMYRPSLVQGDKLYLQGFDWLGQLDLTADKFTLLRGKSPAGVEAQVPAGLPADFSAAFPDKLYHAGYVWQPFPFSRQPIGGSQEEFLPHVTRRTPFNVSAHEALEAVGPRDLLVGDQHGLYLVHLKDSAAPVTAPTAIPKKAPAKKNPEAGPLPLRAVGIGHANRVYRGVFTPDGKTFCSAGGDRVIRAWDTANGKERFTLKGHASPLQGLGLAGDRLLVSGGEDGTIYLWDLARRQKVGELPRHKQAIHCLAVSADGKLLATGGGTWNSPLPGELRLWDLDKRVLLAELPAPGRLVMGVAFAPDGKHLAVVDYGGDIKVWDVATRKPVSLHDEHPAFSVQFSPDGKTLAIGDFWGKLRLYDAASLGEEAEARGHRGAILSLCYAPRGNLLATVGHDGKILLWNPYDIEDHEPLGFRAHKGSAWLVVFAPDGRTLASAGESGRVKFWDVPPPIAKGFQPPAANPPVAAKAGARLGLPKVAVLAASNEETARALQELALARLSGGDGLRLLDRSTVERLLQEQKLSLSGLVDASTAVRAGKILAADVLAVVEYSPQTRQNASVVVFDAATGARLVDAGFADPGLEAQAVQVAAGVRAAAAKWRTGPGSLKTVCFLPVRNADLPPAMDRFCGTLAAMLEREMLGGGLAVLERKRLDLVTKEKGLAEEAANRQLLASLVLVEMDVSHARQGDGIRASVTLRDNAGKELGSVAQEVNDPNGAGLLAPLARKMRDVLQAAPVNARANRNREARRFLREAQLLWKHKYYLQGLQAADAAFALRQGDDQRQLLTEYLFYYATELVHPGGMRTLAWGTAAFPVTAEDLAEALTDARRAMQLIDAGRALLPNPGDAREVMMRVETFPVLDAERHWFNKLPYIRVAPPSAQAQVDFDAFRQFVLRRTVQRCFDAAAGPDKLTALTRYTSAMTAAASPIARAAPSPAAYTAALHDLAAKWLELARPLPPEKIALDSATAFGTFLDKINAPPLLPTSPGRPEAEATLDVLTAAVKSANPIVRLYATHFQIRLLEKLGRLPRDQAIARHRAMLAEGERLIDHPPFGPTDKFRVTMYRLLNYDIGHLYLHKTGASVIREYFDLCDFMLARGDVVEDVVNAAVGYGSPLPELNVKALQIIDKALQVTDSPTRRLFADAPDRFRFQIKQARQKVLTKLPELLKAGIPWESARAVATTQELKATALLPGLVHDGQFYFFASGPDPATTKPLLRLMRVPVEGGAVKMLGKAFVSVDNQPTPQREFSFWWYAGRSFVTTTAVAGERLFAGTVTDGVLVFPLFGGSPTRIGEKEGLPARFVQKLAVVDDALFVALEGGYLVTCDLATGKCETVASSRRREKLSPFDNTSPFTVAGLAADPPRHRVLFTLHLSTANDPRSGLWEFDVKTRQFRKVQPYIGELWSEVTSGRIYVYHSDVLKRRPDTLLAYELAEDRFVLLHGEPPVEYGTVKLAKLPKDLTVAFLGRGLLRHGYFWQVYPFGRHTLDEKKQDYFPTPRDNSWTYAFSAMLALRPAGPHELLVGDYAGLYLLRLKGQ